MYLTGLQALQDEGSPVDVAKSYMRSLPPWSSPSGDHSKPLTPIGFQLSREGTPYPVSGYSALSTKVQLAVFFFIQIMFISCSCCFFYDWKGLCCTYLDWFFCLILLIGTDSQLR